MKKAVELSLNTIIVAAIALLVLIVLVVIYTGQSGKFVRGLNDCKARGGGDDSSFCRSDAQTCMNEGGTPSGDCVFVGSDGKIDKSMQDRVCCVFKK
jgi:hypothetical protein